MNTTLFLCRNVRLMGSTLASYSGGPSSNLGSGTCYPEWDFSWFFLSSWRQMPGQYL